MTEPPNLGLNQVKFQVIYIYKMGFNGTKWNSIEYRSSHFFTLQLLVIPQMAWTAPCILHIALAAFAAPGFNGQCCDMFRTQMNGH
jgi:hypothetical protein